jgi:hypothetical protein
LLDRLARDAELDDRVLAVDVAEIPRPAAEGLAQGGVAWSRLQEPDPRNRPRRLCFNGERHDENADEEEKGQRARPGNHLACLSPSPEA